MDLLERTFRESSAWHLERNDSGSMIVLSDARNVQSEFNLIRLIVKKIVEPNIMSKAFKLLRVEPG